ncbi:MAG: hypothetical protein QXP35_01390 [Candidatus Micrarchaeaceae archaeon]|nr:exonuclease V [Candidatus Marsarchaeota archaeon]
MYISPTMKKLNKYSIRVTDIASQYWCELQMELNYLYGQKLTSQISAGKTLHDDLENKISVPLILQPKNYADYLFKDFYKCYTALNSLDKNKKAREITLYGTLNSFKLIGKIDQLELKNNSTLLIEDKTRSNGNVPSEAQTLTHKIQIMVYRKMLGNIISKKFDYKAFKNLYSLDRLQLTQEFVRQLDALNIEKDLQSLDVIAGKFFAMISEIKNLSNILYLRYINQNTGNELKLFKFEYDENYTNSVIDFSVKYWNGERKAIPVQESEKWKCSLCKFFGKECKVWWNDGNSIK